MTTKAKITFGKVTYQGNIWEFEETFFVNYDGYPENIIPILKSGNLDKFELLEHFNDFSAVDFIYYIDDSNPDKVCCTILEFNWDFYNHFGVDNYKVVKELIL